MISGHILIRDDHKTLRTATALLRTVIAIAAYCHCFELSLL